MNEEILDMSCLPEFDQDLADTVPAHLHPGLARYLVLGIPPGGFLKAVICNDLKAVMLADDTSYRALRKIIGFLYVCAPAAAYGSQSKLDAWVERGGWKGKD